MPADEATSLSPPSTWVDTYGDYLYGFAFYRVQDDELARELVQETLLAALKAKDSFAGRGSEKTWLKGVIMIKNIAKITGISLLCLAVFMVISAVAKMPEPDPKALWEHISTTSPLYPVAILG